MKEKKDAINFTAKQNGIMSTYRLSKTFSHRHTISTKAADVCRMFGISAERLREGNVTHRCCVDINAGDIVYITGPSGAGKTVLLKELEKSMPASEKVNINEMELPADKAVIDCFAGDILQGLRMLSTAGLNDVFCVLNTPANLSDGQKYRFRLAMAIAAEKKFVFADEFCSTLDRVTAAVISYHLHKFAKRNNVTFILASSHEDILTDLSPDVLVVKELNGGTEVIYKRNRCPKVYSAK
jgi:ABC-type ATPase with predicted acetyltransferase domain